MKTERKYQFSLEFPKQTAEQVQAGELLKKLGANGSNVVVRALSEYIQAHPELVSNEGASQIRAVHNTGLTREDVLKLIREELAKNAAPSPAPHPAPSQSFVRRPVDQPFVRQPVDQSFVRQSVDDESTDAMLANLDGFFS
ncbi:MAG: hypothetical protein LBT21_03465 [Oscillospiraceae bacterium]|nr:hypothetical protein [Oscillospiraceae bacterium]